MKKYSGQAIAIIMIVLVVAVVIGGSLYSRVVRNKGEVVDTIDSQKALEQAGNVLDAFVAIDLSSLQNLISQQLKSSPNEEIILDNLSKINEFLLLLNSEDNLDLSLLDLGNDNLCSEPVVNITYAQLTDGIEYEVGNVMAINVGGRSIPSGCQAQLSFYTSGSGDHLFTTETLYMDSNGSVHPYSLEDMELYCLNNLNSYNCGDGIISPTSSIKEVLMPGEGINIDFSEYPNLYEFRIVPLKEKIRIGLNGNESCNRFFDNYLIKSTVNCNGQERTMQVVIPNVINVGYYSIFDYTLYNSSGILSTYYPEP